MLKVEKISAAYQSIRVLKDVSIHVPKGKVVSIIGANGAGKSTLLKAISGLMKIHRGRILYKGHNIAAIPAHKIVGMGISQVPEGRQLFAHLSVQDNIHLGAYHYFKKRNRRDIEERVKQMYQIFPILEKRSKQIAGTLSGGEQQRERQRGGAAPREGEPLCGFQCHERAKREPPHVRDRVLFREPEERPLGSRDLPEPGVVRGEFASDFLSLPRELLVTTLRFHQKCFSVQDAAGALLPMFLAVANTDRDPAGHVRRGNEWVVGGRLEELAEGHVGPLPRAVHGEVAQAAGGHAEVGVADELAGAVAAHVDSTRLPLHARPVLHNLECGKFEKISFLTGTLRGLLDRPDEGFFELGGREVGSLDRESRAHLRNEMIGFVFQHHYLLDELDALDRVPSVAEIRLPGGMLAVEHGHVHGHASPDLGRLRAEHRGGALDQDAVATLGLVEVAVQREPPGQQAAQGRADWRRRASRSSSRPVCTACATCMPRATRKVWPCWVTWWREGDPFPASGWPTCSGRTRRNPRGERTSVGCCGASARGRRYPPALP